MTGEPVWDVFACGLLNIAIQGDLNVYSDNAVHALHSAPHATADHQVLPVFVSSAISVQSLCKQGSSA